MIIIIPSDNPDLAFRCVQSIANTDPSFIPSTVIVTGDIALMRYVQIRFGVIVLQRPDPFIYAQAVNTAIKQLPGESYFLLNDDAVLTTQGGLSLMEQLTRYEELGVVSAGIKGIGGALNQQVATNGALRLVGGHVSFCAALIPAHTIEKVGLLDERYTAYGFEDNDYCERCHQEGLKIGVFDGCVARHEHISSSFGVAESGAFSEKMIEGEVIYWRKWQDKEPGQIIVLGESRSGASVVAHCLKEMGVMMTDPAPAISDSSSAYYRDDELASLLKHGDIGIELYVHRRDSEVEREEHSWGTRVFPNVDGVKRIIDRAPRLKIIYMMRAGEAMIRSLATSTGQSWVDAEKMITAQTGSVGEIIEYAAERGVPLLPVWFNELINEPEVSLLEIAQFVGWEYSVQGARDLIKNRLYHFGEDGEIVEWPEEAGWGKVAVGVRISKHPEAQFMASMTAFAKMGLKPDDVLLYPAIGAPAHYAATNLIRQFLLTDCDSLLLVDDDMAFNPDVLDRLRSNIHNWDYDIVTAFTTQRVQPPRAMIFRTGEQPPYPDSTNGHYYSMLVDDVESGVVMGVDACGLAFTLIRRRVLEALTDPAGPAHTHYVQWGQAGEGEDVNFCRRAGSLGFRIAVDCSVHIGHLGTVVYGWDEFDYWRRTDRSGTGVSTKQLAELVGEAMPYISTASGESAIAVLSKMRE